ncbi:aldo/keto reductase [archaeon]|nr:aldo/keto reductase [archaeon]
MKIPTKKAGNFELPVLGFGTWRMGGEGERDLNNDDTKDVTAIKKAVEVGLYHIDTAEYYAAGHSEELVAKAIADIPRDELFITTKVSPWNFKKDDLIKSCQASLKRLKVDYVDLYLLHFPSDEIPIAETMSTLDQLVSEGLIKNIGVSNFTVPLIEQAQAVTKNKIVNNQIHFSPTARAHIDNGTVKYCQENDILVTSYRPIGYYKPKYKHLSGEIAPLEPSTNKQLIEDLAKKYNKTPSQIVLNWVIAQPNIVTLFKSTSPEHIKENIGSIGWELSLDDIDKITNEYPVGDTINVPES